MEKSLSGKKLLIISSDGNDIPLVEAGKSLGAYVICCDKYTDYKVSPAKAIADEAWDMDYSETAAVADKCRECGVDGLISGYGEDRVYAASKISEAIGRPFYATPEQINLTRNKVLFKQLCRQHGILTPNDYQITFPVTDDQLKSIRFPVIVKPSDNGGRKGISICQNREELRSAAELALEQSNSKEIVVEDFLTGVEMSAIYTVADGLISLSCLNDKYASEDRECEGMLCSFVCTPSRFLDLYRDTVDGKIKALLKAIGVDNGVATFQMMEAGGLIFVFEMGLRINGNNDFTIIEKEHGLNYCKMLIHYSMTGSMGQSLKNDNPYFHKYYGTFVVLLRSGRIRKIDCSELKEKEEIYDILFTKSEGDYVLNIASNVHKSGLIKFSVNTMEEVKEMIHFIQTHLHIEDENGNDMLFSEFDSSRLDR